MAPRSPRAPVPRKRPQQERAATTVDAILTACERVLDRDGLGGLTTTRVAELAGVSVGTLYQYYPNKEALVRAVSERYLAMALGVCRAALVSGGGVPLPALIERFAVVLVAAYRAQRPIHRWLIELRTAAEFQQGFHDALDRFAEDLTVFLAARPDVRFPDTRAAAFVVVNAVEGVIQGAVARGGFAEIAPVVEATGAMLAAYVAAARADA